MDAQDHRFESDGDAAEAATRPAPAAGWVIPETNLEFLSRRALEEGRLAQAARDPKAAAAHRYLAAAYSAEIAKEAATTAAFEELLRRAS